MEKIIKLKIMIVEDEENKSKSFVKTFIDEPSFDNKIKKIRIKFIC